VRNLSKVHHYYDDPHPYFGLDVAVIGGKNSAAIAALELWRHGARVTLIYRGPASAARQILDQARHRKPHQERRDQGVLSTPMSWKLRRTPSYSKRPKVAMTLKNDFVFAITGYHPDFAFLERLRRRVFERSDNRLPVCDPETLESNVSGIYLAGVIVAGSRTSEIFIENGRFHGGQIAQALHCSSEW
jgi:thioredoxin reductase (NADPH)